ncbi:MAG: ABC transporter ATP-binding protein [Oscillospiraceae bacterium]|nr:ABC transporter ATP-binding protein [Oscillospiraceae bacterium]
MSVLTAENVSYRYKNGDRMALNGVNCAFEAGKVIAVVGPSGSGKTTLLSILAGLDRPSAGTVVLNGQDLAAKNLDQYRREDVSVIFQAFQLFPLLTVMENVCYSMELVGISQKEAKAKAGELLAKVGISEEKWKRYPANLSGGEQQRVAIARSMASGAQVLLADEPTGNLDGENSRNVVELLTKLAHEDNYCVVIVTHDPAIAEASDTVYRMADGVLTQEK